MIKKINIKELKNEMSLFLFEKFNFGLDKLKLSMKICEIIGGAINEAIDLCNAYN